MGERSGFTLLEVLVVVAVIALLAAILMPSLSKAREQARRVQCQSNLKQIAAGFEAYFVDSKDRLLRGTNMEYNYGGRQGNGANAFGKRSDRPVPKPLNPYLKLPLVTRTGAEVFACPCDTGTRFVRPSALWYYGTSYYPNPFLVGQNQASSPPGNPCELDLYSSGPPDPDLWEQINTRIANLKRSGIQDASRVVLVGDYSWLDHWDLAVREDFPCWHAARGRHNLAFADGHASFVPIRKGVHVDDAYTIIPFLSLKSIAASCQDEILPP